MNTFFQLPSTQHFLYFLIYLISAIGVQFIYSKYIYKLLLRLFNRRKTDFIKRMIESSKTCICFSLLFIGFYIGMENHIIPTNHPAFVDQLWSSIVILIIGWFFYGVIGTYVESPDPIADKFHINKMIVPYFAKVGKFIIFCIVVTIIAKEWGYDINGVLTGLGLSGIAFAWAARDTFSNMFSGVVLIMEKTISVGDWISVGTTEGVVEEISFRCTKVRTFSDTLAIVPNSKLTNENVTNWSRMGKRRIQFFVGLKLDTPKQKIQEFITDYIQGLSVISQIDQEQIHVHFEKITEKSMEINVECFAFVLEKKDYIPLKQELLLLGLEIAQEKQISIAQLSQPAEPISA